MTTDVALRTQSCRGGRILDARDMRTASARQWLVCDLKVQQPAISPCSPFVIPCSPFWSGLSLPAALCSTQALPHPSQQLRHRALHTKYKPGQCPVRTAQRPCQSRTQLVTSDALSCSDTRSSLPHHTHVEGRHHPLSSALKHHTAQIWASDDGGSTWNETASVGSMMWPQIFSCASGVYVVGVQRFFSNDNNLVVSKMLDEEGTR